MNSTIRLPLFVLLLVSSLTLSLAASAQQAASADLRMLRSYNVNREVSLVGTVVKFDPASTIPPIGAHVTLQTASGPVDVHLGNAKLLTASHMTLNPGDNVRVVGEALALDGSTYFGARIVQKGMQIVAVRNTRGFPLSPVAQKEALRGVR
jgi:hypothetical protein